MSELPLASNEFKTAFYSKCLLFSQWKKNVTDCYALKWIIYTAMEGFGHSQYNTDFKLEISSAMRGEALNSSLDRSSDPPASGRLRAPWVSLHVPGNRKAKAVPSPSCCLQCGVMQWHMSLPNAWTWIYSTQDIPSLKKQSSHSRRRTEVAACAVKMSKWLLHQVGQLLVSSGIWAWGHSHVGSACHSPSSSPSLASHRNNMAQMILHVLVPNWAYNTSVLRPQFYFRIFFHFQFCLQLLLLWLRFRILLE